MLLYKPDRLCNSLFLLSEVTMGYTNSFIDKLANQAVVEKNRTRGKMHEAIGNVLRSYKDIPAKDWKELFRRVGKSLHGKRAKSAVTQAPVPSQSWEREYRPENGYMPEAE